MGFVPGTAAGLLMSYAMIVSGEAARGFPVEFRLAPLLVVSCWELALARVFPGA